MTDNKDMNFSGLYSFFLILSLLFGMGCLKEGEVTLENFSGTKAQVTKVQNQNGKLVIEGNNLKATQKVRLKGNSIENQMVIESKSQTRIVAALSQALTITASAIYELILSNAYGQSVYQLSFELQNGQVTTAKLADGAVTGDKISDMGAMSGQILKFNGSTWSPADLNSLVYVGTWDASTGTEPSSSAIGGDFWIVDTDGDVDLGDGNGVRQWRVGDWIVYNGITTQWDQVISSQSVVSFNGRTGEVTPATNDYTWQQINKTLAPIDDLTDVDTSTVAPSNGEVLKWDGANWTPQVDSDSGGDITDVNAGVGLLGGATTGSADLDIDVGTGANQIPQLDGSGLLLDSIIPGLDASKVTSGIMDATRLPNASSTTAGIISASDYQTFSNTDSTLSNGALGEYLDGDGNWYVLDNSAVGLGNVLNQEQIPAASLDTNANLGTDDTLVPSQNAVKSYVDNSLSTASNDYLLRDGTQAMTGNLDVGTHNVVGLSNVEVSNELKLYDDDDSNYVALKAPSSVTTNQTWLLPTADGDPGQVLSTNGSGGLLWSDSADGSVTDVTATLPLSSSGTTTPDISISQSNSTTDGYLSSVDWNTFNDKQDSLNIPADSAQYLNGAGTWQALNTDVVAEASNEYFTIAKARSAAVENQIVSGVTDRAPSQDAVDQALGAYVLKAGDTMGGSLDMGLNSVINLAAPSLDTDATTKKYVDDALALKANDSQLSNYVEIAGSNMTGALGLNAQNEVQFRDSDSSHYVALRAPASLSSNVTFNLPNSDGSAGQVLSTDSFGNLSWASSADGSVTDVTASAPLSSSGGATPDISLSQASSGVDGYLSGTDWNTFNNKEPAITAGLADQYWSGGKTWQTLDTSAVAENGSLYFTDARARAAAVENQIVSGVTDRAPSQDAVDQALGDYVLKTGDTMSGVLNLAPDGLVVGTSQLVASGANVGIGTASPSEKLEVSGNIKSTGTVQPGSFAASGGAACDPTTEKGKLRYNETLDTMEFCKAGTSQWTIISEGLSVIGDDISGRRYSNETYAKTCYEYLNGGNYRGSTGSGNYWIDPDGAGAEPEFLAYCDMTTNGGGYTRVKLYTRQWGNTGGFASDPISTTYGTRVEGADSQAQLNDLTSCTGDSQVSMIWQSQNDVNITSGQVAALNSLVTSGITSNYAVFDGDGDVTWDQMKGCHGGSLVMMADGNEVGGSADQTWSGVVIGVDTLTGLFTTGIYGGNNQISGYNLSLPIYWKFR